jgi:hypothetical protein
MTASLLQLFLSICLQGCTAMEPLPLLSEKVITRVSPSVDYINNRKVQVPRLVGLSLSDAMRLLGSKKLKVGLILADEQIKNFTISDLTVYIQNPKEKRIDGGQNYIHKGDEIDLWITDNKSKIVN